MPLYINPGRFQADFDALAEFGATGDGGDSLALAHTATPSGAGHDAQSLAPITETGMIFIPSRDGISHSPLEHSDWGRCTDGANVLLRAALKPFLIFICAGLLCPHLFLV